MLPVRGHGYIVDHIPMPDQALEFQCIGQVPPDQVACAIAGQGGTSILAENDDIEYGVKQDSHIDYTIQRSGTYYLKVSPPEDDYAGYCDAVYTLTIMPLRARVFLPVTHRTGE